MSSQSVREQKGDVARATRRVQYHLGMVYMQLGHRENARKVHAALHWRGFHNLKGGALVGF